MPSSEQEIINIIIIGTALILIFGGFIVFFIIAYRKRQQKFKLEKEHMRINFQNEILRTQLEIQEQTFKNISQEIHDNIGQALTLAKLNLNTMPSVSDEQKEKITTTKEIISKTIADLRDLSRGLNTDYIADMGLQKAIEYEFGLISRSSSIITELHTEGSAYRLDKQKELILFRIIQELLNNTIKHAAATSIKAMITYNPDEFILSIRDDGKGFVIKDTENKDVSGTGLGLRNMNNRAKLIGASFTMNSKPGTGTEVRIILPISHT